MKQKITDGYELLELFTDGQWRQHPSATARTSKASQSIQHLSEVRDRLAIALGRLREKRTDNLPLRLRQVAGIVLGSLLEVSHPATAHPVPHPELDSRKPLPPFLKRPLGTSPRAD